MPTRRHAHLLLPSPLGLLEYDVLEDAVFLGPGKRSGLQAKPAPFKQASVALTKSDGGYVARALPGENAPDINGSPAEERKLKDGDRIRIGDQVALFRTDRGPVRVAAEAKPATVHERRSRSAEPRRGGRERKSSRPDRRVAATVGLIAAAVVLGAVVRAVGHLKDVQHEEQSSLSDLPLVPIVPSGDEDLAAREYKLLVAYEQNNPNRFKALVERFRGFVNKHPGRPEVDAAQAKLREIMTTWAERERGKLEEEVDGAVAAQQFSRALRRIREFESRFGATRAGQGTEPLRDHVRERAREALDAIKNDAAPLIDKNARLAHNILVSAGASFPPDMAAEITELLRRARLRMREDAKSGDGRNPRALPPKRRDEPRKKPPGVPQPLDPDPSMGEGEEPSEPKAPNERKEEQAREAWRLARADLTAKQYEDALRGYTILTQQYADSETYQKNKDKIAMGRLAAKAGVEGPAALVSVDATMNRGRIELEYNFDKIEVYENDFTEEQPFSSAHAVDVKLKRGKVSMAGASGVLHRLVFLPDVRVEALVTAEVAHDFGLLAVEESDKYRALIFSINNTEFKLKKGDNRKANPGHVLWYVGEGVWSAADEGAHGFIKIAERSTSKLEGGEKFRMELERRKNDLCEAGFGAKSDGVHLKGKVRGDDGSGMKSARVGVFTNTGIITLHQLKISGKVDMAWFEKELEWLASADPGPQ